MRSKKFPGQFPCVELMGLGDSSKGFFGLSRKRWAGDDYVFTGLTSVIYMCYGQLEAMVPTLFTIKSLLVQNAIMLVSMTTVTLFFFRALWKKNLKQVVVFLAWFFVIVWFFNSSFFGFSEVSITPMGIRLNYGLWSLRNATVSFQTPWEIQTHMSGIRKTKRLYYLRIGDHNSMKVRGLDGVSRLEEIGAAIDRGRRTGGVLGKGRGLMIGD